jgi:hypothetical protein
MDRSFRASQDGALFVPVNGIKDIELFLLHGSMRVIRVEYESQQFEFASQRVDFVAASQRSYEDLKTGS